MGPHSAAGGGQSAGGDAEGNTGGAVGRPLHHLQSSENVPWKGNSMASIRTVRVLAAVAALPLAGVLFAGTAAADDGSFAGGHSNATVVSNSGGNALGNSGNVTTTQQAATGAGASNQDNTASVAGSAFTAIHQNTVAIHFSPLW
jgi:hypothetical protein